MNLKKIKKLASIFGAIMLLSGCTATYNLDITSNTIHETLNIYSISVDNSNYYIPAYYNSISHDEYDVDVNRKIDGIIYYNNTFNSNNASFDYEFKDSNFSKSNIINTYFTSVIFKKYDHDNDGKKDYYILSTTDDFSAFKLYDQLTEVTIKIKNDYEVISTNADEIEDNTYIWHFTPNNNSSINMVYNPDKVVDYRSIWEKIQDGEYTNIFTISLLIVIIGFIIYKFFKKYSRKRDEI